MDEFMAMTARVFMHLGTENFADVKKFIINAVNNEIANTSQVEECPYCSGAGEITFPGKAPISCGNCKGTGTI